MKYILMSFALGLLVTLAAVYKLSEDPKVVLLTSQNNADWIKFERPFEFRGKPYKKVITEFRKNIVVSNYLSEANIHVRMSRFCKIFFDDELIYESSTIPDDWKKTNHVKINNISPGSHELIIMVMNYDGPPLLLVHSDDLNVTTNESWETSQGNGLWQKAVLAKKPLVTDYTKQFIPSYLALNKTLPVAIVVLVLCILSITILSKYTYSKLISEHIQNSVLYLRWVLLFSWVILAIFSLVNYPLSGPDYTAHLDYIIYIYKNQSLPLATDGWEMFQSPLYYLVCASIFSILHTFLDYQTSLHLTKIVPILCGIGITEICYRTLIVVFPDKLKMQFVGLIVGGLMPISLYMAQYVGNETTAALFCSLIILVIVKFIRKPSMAESPRQQIILGCYLGLGLLSKISVVLLILPIFAAFIWVLYKNNKTIREIVIGCFRVSALIFLIAGWYYIRNLIYLGELFVGGWNAENGVQWWQDPGYRVLDNFSTFGLSLIYPIYSATNGFWDSLYSTFWVDGFLGGQVHNHANAPWNFSFMLSLPLLSLVPSLLITIGMVPITRNGRFSVSITGFLCTSCVIIYVAALLYFYIYVPTYVAAKSTYTLGLLPCYAILCAKGFDTLSRGKVTEAFLGCMIILWGVYSYISYFPGKM